MARGKYARKRQLQLLRNHSLEETSLSKRVVRSLDKANIKNMADLVLCSECQLKEIPGIGEKAIHEILALKEEMK